VLKAAGVSWLRASDISQAMKKSKKRLLNSGNDQAIDAGVVSVFPNRQAILRRSASIALAPT
jgi:hypothetical protein